MESRTIYSMMAMSVMPGAMMAAVNVPVTQEAQVAGLSGDVYKVDVPFGKLVPGKYTLTAMVTQGTVDQVTIAGVNANISGMVVSATITLTEEADVTLEATSATQFTLGTYLLKLDWNLNKDAWNTLIANVRTKVGTTFDGKLTEAHKTAFLDQLTAREDDIEALTDEYKTYEEQELWKLDGGDDKFSVAIKKIESDAEAQVIEDCWAAKTAAYDEAVADVPTERLSNLQSAIEALTINKDKRQEAFNTIEAKVTAYSNAATEALGSKKTTWEDAIDDVFEFEPDPTLEAILAELTQLEGYVATDKANTERYATMTERVNTAIENIGKVDTDKTLNVNAKTANITEKENIQNALAKYSVDAKDDYEQTVAADGEAFDYDNEYAELKGYEDRTAALSAKITEDNKAYNAANETLKGVVSNAMTYYNQKMTELAENITEADFQDILEEAQTQLLEQKTALGALEKEWNDAYEAGEDLPGEDAAKEAVQPILDNMDGIVNTAIDKAKTSRDELQAKTNALDAIAAAKTQLAAANTTINDYNTMTAYGTPSNYWKAEYAAIETSLDDIAATVANEFAAGTMATYYGDGETSDFANALAAIAGEEGTIAKYITDAKAAIDLFKGFYSYFYTNCPNRLTNLTNAVKNLPIYEDTEVLFDETTNYKAIIARIQEKIDAAQAASKSVLEMTGADHLAELTRMCEKRSKNDYANYYIGVSIKKGDGTVLGERGNTGGLANTISYLQSSNTEYTINILQALYDTTAFTNYKTTQTEALDAMSQDGDSDAAKKLIADAKTAIEALEYNDEKTLDENKAVVDEIMTKLGTDLQAQRADDAAEAAAAELVDYMYDLVGSTKTTLSSSVNDYLGSVTGKMGVAEEGIQTSATALKTAIEAIEETRGQIKAAPIQDDVEGDPNLYNSNVKKVNAYNELLAKIGKTTDELPAEGEGSLYAQYNDLKSKADAAVAAKKVNDDVYNELNGQLTDLQNSLDAEKDVIAGYAKYVQEKYAKTVTDIQGLIDKDKATLDKANNEQKLTKTSTNANKSKIEAAIASLTSDANATQAAYEVNETAYNELKKQFDADVEGSLQAQLNAAVDYINTEDKDVAASFKETLDGIQDQIDKAKAALDKDAADVKLTASSTIAGKAAIEKDIEDVKKAADKKQSKYNANATLTQKYNEVNIYLSEQRSSVVAAAGDANTESGAAAIAYYKNFFNGTGGFVEQLAAIKASIAENYNNEEIDAEDFMNEITSQLDNLQTEIGKVLKVAQDNKNSYDKQTNAYDAAAEVYTTNYEKLTDADNYEQNLVEKEIEALQAYSPEDGQLKAAKATIENNYGAGKALEVEKTVLETTLPEIVSGINAIITTLDGTDEDVSYYWYVKDANDATLSEVETEIQKINQAYKQAVAVLNEYTSAQDDGLNAYINDAAKDLNEAVFGTVQQMTEFRDQASAACAANTQNKTVWDASDLMGEIQDYIETLDNTKKEFTDGVKDEIVAFWDGVKEARQATIGDVFETLTVNGYIEEETAEDLFADAYKFIEQGDKEVYKTNEEGAITEEVKDQISIAKLDNLLSANGVLNEDNFLEGVEAIATDFAKEKVAAAILEYTDEATGQKTQDWNDIVAIFGDHGLDYGKPKTETGVEQMFDDAVQYLVDAEQKQITYDVAFEEIEKLLNDYDDAVEEIKKEAKKWVVDQEAADAELAEMQAELQAAQTKLAKDAEKAEEAFTTLAGKVNATSVASNHVEDLYGIGLMIEEAKAAANLPVPTSIDDLPNAIEYVNAQDEVVTQSGQGTVTFEMTNVENTAISELKSDLGQQIPDLKILFNAYAASAEANEETVNDWNTRLQNAIKLTGAEYEPTLDEMISLEQDLAKLTSEMNNVSEDMTETIADFKARTKALQETTLEGDYGAADYTDRLDAIHKGAKAIADEVAQHEADGDILGYVDNIESRIKGQETAWEKLAEEAQQQAEKVAKDKEIVESLNVRIKALQDAKIEGEFSPVNTKAVEDGLKEIKEGADGIADEIKASENIQADEDGWNEELTDLENVLEELKEQAEEWAADWSAQKELSDGVYEELSALLTEVESAINTAKTAIEGFSYEGKDNELGNVNNSATSFNSYKERIEESKAAYTLNEGNKASYTRRLNSLLNSTRNYLNTAAKKEAQALYTTEDSELMSARRNAWDTWFDWTFAVSVKNEVSDALNDYDNQVIDLRNDIDNDTDSYDQLESYATTAADLIAKYNAKTEEMNGYEVFGDANLDGKVNVLDYQKVTNMILDPTLQPTTDTKLFKAIDINQNEVIEVGDLTAIVNYILNKDWQGYDDAAASRGLDGKSEGVTMTTSMTEQGTKRIAVNLKNVGDYTAFQLDVVLPEGMKIVGKQLGSRAADSHNLWSRVQQDGSIRFLASSIKGDTFSGSEGAVLYIDVEGAGNVELVNILFSEINAGTRAFNVSDSETTGINATSTFETLKQKVYDLSGRVKDGLKKGINIIRRADGSTQKVAK